MIDMFTLQDEYRNNEQHKNGRSLKEGKNKRDLFFNRF